MRAEDTGARPAPASSADVADLLRRLDERTAQTPCACVNGNCRMHLLGPATYCDGHRSLDDALLREARAELERLYGITR